jgi:hypothetical protein
MRIAYNEQGANPEGVQGIIESMMNAAFAERRWKSKRAGTS